MTPPTNHPLREIYDSAPAENRHYVQCDQCPGCGKPLRAFGEYISFVDPASDPPLIALTAVCWRCKHRIEINPKWRQKILSAIKQTMRLVVDVGGSA